MVRRAPVPKEDAEQLVIFEWRGYNTGKYPELEMLRSDTNGGLRPYGVDKKGARYSNVAKKLKALGASPGYPDISLDVARGGFHGLRIELKRRPGPKGGASGSVTSPEQEWWISALRRSGYAAFVCRGADQAITCIVAYLECRLTLPAEGS